MFADLVYAALHNVETISCLEIQPPGEGINICGSRMGQLSHHVQTVIRVDKGVDTNGKTRYVIPLSLYSDKTHVDGRQKKTTYPLMMSIADRASHATLLAYLPVLQHRPRDKGWGLHSIAFRKRKVVILHKALSIVLRSAKDASHDGMIVTMKRFSEITVHPFIMNYIQDYHEKCALATVKFGVCPTCTVSKDDFDVIANFPNYRRAQTLETQLAANCFNNGDNDIRRAAEARMSELNMYKHVQENGLWGFYRALHGDDPQLDYHLALQPDRMQTIEHDIFLHMIDAFKAAAYKKLSDIARSSTGGGNAGEPTEQQTGGFTKEMKDRLFRSVTKVFAFSAAKDAMLYPSEDLFFTTLQTTAKLIGEHAEEGLRLHVAANGIRAVIGECNRIMTTVRGEISWQLKHWFWAEKGLPLVRSAQTDHQLPILNRMRAEMKGNTTWRRSGNDPWGTPPFKTALTKVFQMRRDDINLGVTLQQLAFADVVLKSEVEQTAKTSKPADQIQKLVAIKKEIAASVRSRDTVLSYSIFKFDRAVSVADKAVALYRVGLPAVQRADANNMTTTDDDFDLEFIAHTVEKCAGRDRDEESLCARP
ncbi:hypothetical protein CBR_g20111 [Chara braunii]|uniref:Uncharacterized protein n=1 Tax=Chara braunii TaxID=69332 RepID=A0A388KZJ4_CHABU|nr:hypothetical protein CBR_g20111 [Chara braunii]|eukprot:GBG75480.1 hypothetical protein CBR_g20111 [Chara braunii]